MTSFAIAAASSAGELALQLGRAENLALAHKLLGQRATLEIVLGAADQIDRLEPRLEQPPLLRVEGARLGGRHSERAGVERVEPVDEPAATVGPARG